MLAACMGSLNVAVMFAVREMAVAPLAGDVAVTVGAVVSPTGGGGGGGGGGVTVVVDNTTYILKRE